MNYEHISLRGHQVETLKRYSDDIERRFDVEFYVKHGNSLLRLCGSTEDLLDTAVPRPTRFAVFIRTKTPESQQNIPLAKVRLYSCIIYGVLRLLLH